VYRLGAGGWGFDKNGDRIKTGLWGYAEAMGIEMTLEQAQEIVKIFRESYPEICANGYGGGMKGIWVQLEDAVMDVLNGQKTVRKLGPEGCIVIDKVTIAGRNPMLRIKLPSGRYLHYLDASIETTKMPWQRKNQETGEMEDVYKPALCYYGMNQDTKQWEMIVSHGGKIFENCVQGLARDVLADKLLEFEDIGLETVAHVHDEGICLSDDDPFAPGVLEMEAIMNTPVLWAPTLPLGSDGFESLFYHK
jgi:DNA polymerase